MGGSAGKVKCFNPSYSPFFLVTLVPHCRETFLWIIEKGKCGLFSPLKEMNPPPSGTSGTLPYVIANSPVAKRLNRRFYHLGVVRSDLPVRDVSQLQDPESVAYFPVPAVGLNPQHELQRLTEFHASGAPPPLPKYFSDVDRCRHFAHGRGGTDVGPHFVNRPSYQLSTGAPPLSMYSPLLKEMLAINASALEQLNTSSGVSSTTEHGSRSREGRSPSPYGAGQPVRRSSVEVARSSSSLEATRAVRRRHHLVEQQKLLRVLTKLGHPNQVTVYLPQPS